MTKTQENFEMKIENKEYPNQKITKFELEEISSIINDDSS